MSVYATVNVTRGKTNTLVLANQPVQIDNMSIELGSYYGGKNPFDSFEIYVRYSPFTFLREDLLTDTVNLDPLTGNLAAYRVVGNPEHFPDGHWELKANRYVTP